MQNNIDKILRQKGKTPTWLINQIGIEKKWSVYKWIENTNQPSVCYLYKIAKALGVTMEELVCE